MIVKSFVLRFFVVALSEAGLNVDRFVIRENNSFEMYCSSEHRNVTRVRWEYISSNKSRNETIYDSQSREILKDGFEISCQPDQKFISTCTLKLLHARKEDSGYYVCSVGDEAQLSSNLLKFIVEIELVIRGPKYDTVVVSEGEQVILQCEHNIKNLTRARWSHVSTKGVVTYQLYYMDWTKAYYYNYQGQCEPHSRSCNLKILEAKKESAGKYICMVGESQEFEDKYGLDEMTYFIEIQLVVGELKCNENMNKDLTLIGENDCYGIEADVLNLKCSFNYFGNINYNLLHLRWIEKYKFNSLEKKLNSSLINHEVKDETKKISIQTNLSVAYEMQNSIFQCILDDTQVKPCQVQEFRVQLVKNGTRSPPIYLNDLHNIKCSANKSENVHCSYYWIHEVGGAVVQNPYAILPVENMNSPGNYTCIGKCHVRNHECTIKAMEFQVIPEPNPPTRLHSESQRFLITSAVIVTSVMILATYFSRKWCWKCIMNLFERLSNRNAEASSSVSAPLMKRQDYDHLKGNTKKGNNITNTGFPRREDLKKLDKIDETSSRCSTEPTESNIQFFEYRSLNEKIKKDIFQKSERSLIPFENPAILEKKTSKHGEILIYETKNSHGRVFMIDDIIWDTNHKGRLLMENMIFNAFKLVQKPRKVLVIGRGELRILKAVKELKISSARSHEFGIESISSYDIDEDDSDKSMDLLSFYRHHFSELARYLDDPEINHIKGSIDFLKDQKTAFDVIIIHSPSSFKSPFDLLFEKQYLESVKDALKQNGVAMLIVSGQNIERKSNESSILDIQYLCEKIFPGVKYFAFNNFPIIKPTSGLTRCLICGLKEKADLEKDMATFLSYFIPSDPR